MENLNIEGDDETNEQDASEEESEYEELSAEENYENHSAYDDQDIAEFNENAQRSGDEECYSSSEDGDELEANINHGYKPFRDAAPTSKPMLKIVNNAQSKAPLTEEDIRRRVAGGLKSKADLYSGRKRNKAKATKRSAARETVKSTMF